MSESNGKSHQSMPQVLYTLKGNLASEEVVNAMKSRIEDGLKDPLTCRVFTDEDEVRVFFSNGTQPASAIALFDGEAHGGWMRAVQRREDRPSWAKEAGWCREISQRVLSRSNRPIMCAQDISSIGRNLPNGHEPASVGQTQGNGQARQTLAAAIDVFGR